MDILVFIAEFRDVVDLFRSLVKKVSEVINAAVGLSQLARDWSRYNGLLFKALRGKSRPGAGLVRLTVDKAFTRLSNEWLEYNFALRPLASDLIGILAALLDFNMKLQMLKSQANTILKIHRKIDDEEWIPYEDLHVSECVFKNSLCAPDKCLYKNRDESRYEDCTGGAVRKRYATMHSTTRGLTVVYRYAWPKALDGLQGSIAALFSSLGLSPGADTVWELIPFSFVVDWFLPLQAWFAQFQSDPSAVKTEILDLCMTKRLRYSYDIVARPMCPVNPEHVYGRVSVDHFRRAVGADLLTRVPLFKWPNWMQISLGAALIKGRVRYRG
jgi:DNA-binding phage protein